MVGHELSQRAFICFSEENSQRGNNKDSKWIGGEIGALCCGNFLNWEIKEAFVYEVLLRLVVSRSKFSCVRLAWFAWSWVFCPSCSFIRDVQEPNPLLKWFQLIQRSLSLHWGSYRRVFIELFLINTSSSALWDLNAKIKRCGDRVCLSNCCLCSHP